MLGFSAQLQEDKDGISSVVLKFGQALKSLAAQPDILLTKVPERILKFNPKTIWKYNRSKKGCSNIPTYLTYREKNSESTLDTVNLFAEFFKSNYGENVGISVCSDLEISQALDFAGLSVTELYALDGFAALQLSLSSDLEGFSSFVLKMCISSVSATLKYIFNLSMPSGFFMNR